MLALKGFLQDSVHALDDAQLQRVSETLRVDLRGCSGRHDMERVLTGLLCLDQDTALGTFLSWLQTLGPSTETSRADRTAAKKVDGATTFANTFVPKKSRLETVSRESAATPAQSAPNQVKEHHLSEQIASHLKELVLMEQEFKLAERGVHHGPPSFDKLKAFLVKLTRLRTKEEELREYFLRQSHVLITQHAEMKSVLTHTQEQLEFFVDGFTNLRDRHDVLLDVSTHMKAENEVAQELFISMSAEESHFAAILHCTLLLQLKEKAALSRELADANTTIQLLREKQAQLELFISQLKQQRGDARKDANCYRLQLQRQKQKLEGENPDCIFFRGQAMQMRTTLTALLRVFHEMIVRDTKSVKQTVSKEVVRVLQQTLTAPVIGPSVVTMPMPTTAKNLIRVSGAAPFSPEPVIQPRRPARVIEKKEEAGKDVDQVIQGIVLLGGNENEAEECALMLKAKLKYAVIDLDHTLRQLQEEEMLARAQFAAVQISLALETQDQSLEPSPSPSPSSTSFLEPIPPIETSMVTIEGFWRPLQARLAQELKENGARGLIFFNWEMTARDVDRLIAMGFPIDSIIELKSHSPSELNAANTMANQARVSPTRTSGGTDSSTRSNATATVDGKDAIQRATFKSDNDNSSHKESRMGVSSSNPKLPEARMPVAPASASTASPTKRVNVPKVRKHDRRVAFSNMPHVFEQLEPVCLIAERLDQIMSTLERCKQKKVAPFVQWDDDTSQANEALLMLTEEFRMLVSLEQENRKSKKAAESTPTGGGVSQPVSTGAAASVTSASVTTKTTARTGSPSSRSSARNSVAKPTNRSPTRGSTRASTQSRAASPTKSGRAVSVASTTSTSPVQRLVTSKSSPDRKKTTPSASLRKGKS